MEKDQVNLSESTYQTSTWAAIVNRVKAITDNSNFMIRLDLIWFEIWSNWCRWDWVEEVRLNRKNEMRGKEKGKSRKWFLFPQRPQAFIRLCSVHSVIQERTYGRMNKLIPSNNNSRSEARPIIKTSKVYNILPKPKPGRKKTTTTATTAATAKNNTAELEAKIQHLETIQRELNIQNYKLKLDNHELLTSLNNSNYTASHSNNYTTSSNLNNSEKRQPKRPRSSLLSASSNAPSFLPTSPQSPPEASNLKDDSNGPLGAGDDSFSSCGLCTSLTDCLCSSYTITAPLPSIASSSKKAIPLRSRSTATATGSKPSVWSLKTNDEAVKGTGFNCSGDPATCGACSNDRYVVPLMSLRQGSWYWFNLLDRKLYFFTRFAQAFCLSLSTSACDQNPCSSCPTPHDSHSNNNPSLASSVPLPLTPTLPSLSTGNAILDTSACCGYPGFCGSNYCVEMAQNEARAEEAKIHTKRARDDNDDEQVPCNEAWNLLKAHKNIGFASTLFSPLLPFEKCNENWRRRYIFFFGLWFSKIYKCWRMWLLVELGVRDLLQRWMDLTRFLFIDLIMPHHHRRWGRD